MSDKHLLLMVAITAAVLLWMAQGILLEPTSVLDDAFITLHNAETLAGLHQSSVFVPQSSLTGSTSLLHTCLLTLMLLSGLDGETVLALSTLLGCVLYLVGAVVLINLFNIQRIHKIFLLFLSFFMGVIPNQLTNGLETSLAMAFVLWSIYAYLKGGPVKKWGLPVLLGLMPFVRPELTALSILIFLAWLYDEIQAGNTIKDITHTALHIIGLSLLMMVPFLLLLYSETSSFLPSSIEAKKYFFAEGCENFAEKFHLFFKSIAVFIGPLFLAVLFIPCLRKHALGLALLLFSAVLLAAYWMNAPSSLSHYSGRYCYPLVPIIFYAILVYVNQHQKVSKKMILFYCLLAQTFLFNVLFNGFMFQQRVSFMKNNQRANSQWLKENTLPGDTILVHDVGYLGHILSDRTVIDMVGLKTPEVIRYHKDITWASCGKKRGEAIVEITKHYRPDYVVVFSWWDDDFKLTSKLSEIASLELVRTYNPLAQGGYSVYRLTYAENLHSLEP